MFKHGRHLICSLLILSIVVSASPLWNEAHVASNHIQTSFTPADFAWETFSRDMNVTTFVSPDGSRDEIWHLLQSAQDSIYVEIYGINNPYILDLIHELHDSKPMLEMKFLLGWNSLGYYSPNDYVANNLTELGYPVRWTNDTEFTYAHQKFFIIDNITTVVHSGNWAKTSFPEDGKKANREWSIAMTDLVITEYYRSVFDYDWGNGIDYDPVIHGTGEPLVYTEASSTYHRPFNESGHFSGTMNVTPIVSPETSLQGILYCIDSAKVTLDIQIPYFTSYGDAGAVDDVVDAIIAAKERGVTVRVITEEGQKDNDAVAADLMAYDIPVIWQDERWFTAQHNKGIIVDGRMVLISRINYSDGSITANREAGVIILHEGIAQWYQEIYDFDWGLGDCDVMEEVNLYWEPNIPKDDAIINVTVYTQKLYSDVTEVKLGVRIAEGGWINHTITANVFPSAEGQYENYYHEIAAQPNFTNISVQAFVEALGVWHTGVEMQIRVLNEIDYTFTIDSPEDMEYEAGSIGHSITWSPISYKAHSYEVYRNGTEVASGNWNGSPITVSIDGLFANLYNFTLNVTDTEGLSRYDTVYVRTHPSIDPTITAPADMGYEYGSSGHFLEWESYDLYPNSYQVYRNGTLHLSGNWSGASIVVQVDGLDLAMFNYTLIVFDDSSNSAKSTVWVTVVDTTSPTINHPSDSEVEVGTSGNLITWSPGDLLPSSYEILRNGAVLYSGIWTGSSIVINVDGLALGLFNYTVQVSDTSGNTATDTVFVTVIDTTSPSINGPAATDYLYDSTGNSIVWVGSDILPMSYQILRNGAVIDSGIWDGSDITISIDGLEPGEYNFTIAVIDTSGNTATHTTIVTVTQPLDVVGMLLENWAILVTAVSVLAFVILGSRVCRSKR